MIVIIFLLAVLFVAAIWGRSAAQRLFKGGMIVAGIVFLIIAIIVIMLAINLKAPSQREINQTIQSGHVKGYYVPLDDGNDGNSNDAGAPLSPPVATQPASGVRIAPNLLAMDNYLVGRPVAAQPGTQGRQPAPAVYSVPPAPSPPAAPAQTGHPHFGFGYEPRNGFIVVSRVYAGSPAAAAGLQPGMGILDIDGKDVHQVDDVWAAQYQHHRIGDVVPFTVGDIAGGSHNINIRLGSDAEPWGVAVQ